MVGRHVHRTNAYSIIKIAQVDSIKLLRNFMTADSFNCLLLHQRARICTIPKERCLWTYLDEYMVTLDVIITAWLSKRNNIHNTKIKLIILGDRYKCCNVTNSWRIAIIITIERRVAWDYSSFFAADNILDATQHFEAGDDPPFLPFATGGGGDTNDGADWRWWLSQERWRKLAVGIVAGVVAIVQWCVLCHRTHARQKRGKEFLPQLGLRRNQYQVRRKIVLSQAPDWLATAGIWTQLVEDIPTMVLTFSGSWNSKRWDFLDRVTLWVAQSAKKVKSGHCVPSSRNHLVFPPNGRLSTAEIVSSECCMPTFIIIYAKWSINSWLVESPPWNSSVDQQEPWMSQNNRYHNRYHE